MEPGETLIEMARRHVAQGETHVRSQRDILARLDRDGLPTDIALELLHEFEGSLEDHRESLARIEREQRSGRRDGAGNLLADDGGRR